MITTTIVIIYNYYIYINLQMLNHYPLDSMLILLVEKNDDIYKIKFYIVN